MGFKTILLVRHGEYNLTINFPANPDGSLTEKGIKQGEYLAAYLATLKLDAILTSPLLRASETAQIVAKACPNVPLQSDDLLAECIPVVPTGLEHLFAEIPAKFISEGPAQADAVFQAYFTPLTPDEPDHTEVIISHGNLLGYLMARALNAAAESWLRLDLGNACYSQVRISPSGIMKLIKHNISQHLPAELQGEG
jgi:broad specificity phosphatase PhoE